MAQLVKHLEINKSLCFEILGLVYPLHLACANLRLKKPYGRSFRSIAKYANNPKEKHMEWDYDKAWYHGSPLELKILRKGSTITQDLELAMAFSHKPTVVSISDDGNIKHDGRALGFLYRIAEDVGPRDIHPHPHSSIEYGKEWLTDRDLKVVLLCPTCVLEEEMLKEKEVNDLRTKACSADQQTPR